MKRVTEFQERVYEAVRLIPRGRVTTYGLLAAHIGCGSARAVGQALAKNPFAPVVPCHRVISSDFRIGGYCGQNETGRKVAKKRALLKVEGVLFEEGHLVEEGRINTFH